MTHLAIKYLAFAFSARGLIVSSRYLTGRLEHPLGTNIDTLGRAS